MNVALERLSQSKARLRASRASHLTTNTYLPPKSTVGAKSLSSKEDLDRRISAAENDVEQYYQTYMFDDDDVEETVIDEEDPDRKPKAKLKKELVAHARIFVALFYKKLFLRHRSILTTVVEVFLSPLLVFGIFAAFTHGISWDKASSEKNIYAEASLRFPETEVRTIKQSFQDRYCDAHGRIFLLYFPNTTLARKILNEVLDEFDIESTNRFHSADKFDCDREKDSSCGERTGLIACSSPEELLEMALFHRGDRRKHMEPIGVIFKYKGWENDNDEHPVIPEILEYRIRLFSSEIENTFADFPYVEPARSTRQVSPYAKSGFLGLQYAIDEAYLEVVDDMIRSELYSTHAGNEAGDSKSFRPLLGSSVDEVLKDPNFMYIGKDVLTALPRRIFKMYHYPNFFTPQLRELIIFIVCGTLLASYFFFSYFIVKQIVTENDTGIKPFLKLHNMPVALHWLTLFLHTLLLRFITASLITFMLFQDMGNGAIFSRSNIGLVFIFIYIHMLSLSFFNFFLGSVFDNVLLSGFYTICAGLGSYVIPLCLQQIGLLSFWPNLFVSSICPNWAFVNGIKQIVILECEDKGLVARNYLKAPIGLFLSTFQVTLILFGSGLIYFVTAVFRDFTKQKSITPGYKWYQFKKIRREKRLQKQDHEEFKKDQEEGNKKDDNFIKPDVYEEVSSTEHECFVHVRNVLTLGGKHKIILDHINMNIYHGEITILLGHGGAGKSSMIHVMAGMLTPTHGYVKVFGFDVNYNKKHARKHTGFCPQKCILFNLLTVSEHLTVCYRLRGMSNAEATKHAHGLLTLMKLYEVRNKLPADLTETNKRKLSISLALVDAPKVILLDEPTHGLDSNARREVWSILVNLKKHHTIVIATNRMDEAEYLGDRIGLLSHGKLICFGSPKFLKEQYDTGYFLKIYPEEDGKFHFARTSQIIKEHLDEFPKKDGGEIVESNEVILELPKTKLSRFPKLFDDLDEHKNSLGIKFYSVSQISLYDIFIKICDTFATENEPPDKNFRRNETDTRRKTIEGMVIPTDLSINHKTFVATTTNSIRALFQKRFTVIKNKNDLFMWEYIAPLILIGLVCWHANVLVHPIPDSPPKELSLRHFKEKEVLYRLGATDVVMTMNRDYKKKIIEILKSRGLPLLKTEQVLIKFENKETFRDGYQRERHSIGLEFRQLDQYTRKVHNENKVKDKYLQFVGYFSSGALHSPGVVMNLITNVMLSAMFPHSKSERKIYVFNEPFPSKLVSDVGVKCDASCVIFAVITSFALSLFVGGILVFPIIERRTGMKHVQLMTGVHPMAYWGVEYVCDFILGFVFAIPVVLTFAFLMSSLLVAAGSPLVLTAGLWSLCLIMVLYLCWSSIPFAYYLSTILPVSVSSYNIYIILHMILGWLPVMLLELGNYRNPDPSNSLIFGRNFMHLFPMYTITAAMHRWFEIAATNSKCVTVPPQVAQLCKLTSKHGDHGALGRQNLYDFILHNDADFGMCCDRVCMSQNVKNQNMCFRASSFFDGRSERFRKPMLIQCVAALIFQGFLYWGLLVFVERGVVTYIMHNAVLRFIRTHSKNIIKKRPPDVQKERDKCEELLNQKSIPPDIALICQDLTKSYATMMVVNDVSMAVKKGECIGVLGGGGSGKSTLIKLLCGETLATTGEVFIGDSSIHHHRVEFLTKIGYCPQNFCLFENFTPVQMLGLMGQLRGIPPSQLKSHVNQWLEFFGLLEAKNDKCKDLTIGMRRCVCAAMCVIGGNEIILMDEPTSGIDPISRQKFYAVMKLLAKTGRSIIYTSYNCEEASFLSTRMIVMCEGNVQCLGPPAELIKRFSSGFTILIRIRQDVVTRMEMMSATTGRVAQLKRNMKHTFKHLTLRDEQDNLLLYFLRDVIISWGDVFRNLHDIRERNMEIIEKYYVSEATLEDIFVLLTNKYREMDAPRRFEPKLVAVAHKDADKKTGHP